MVRIMGATTLVGVVVLMLAASQGCSATPPPLASTPALPLTVATPSASSSPAAESVPPSPIPVEDDDPVWGDRLALVTVVVFADPIEPETGKILSKFTALERMHGDEVRFVWKSVAEYGDAGRLALSAALAVFHAGGERAFWAFVSRSLSEATTRHDDLYESWAVELGIDATAYRDAMKGDWVRAKLERDAALARSLRVRYGPVVFVNGRECSANSQCYSIPPPGAFVQLSSVVDEELRHARAALHDGVPRAHVYANRSLANFAVRGTTKTPSQQPEVVHPEWVGARHALIFYQGARKAPLSVVRTKEQALALAARISEEARGSGVSFEDIAAKYTEEPGGAARGGDLGRFHPSSMVSEFSEALLTLRVGEVSDPVETPFGYHVILRTQ